MDPASFAGLFDILRRESLSDRQADSLRAWLDTLSSCTNCFLLIEQATGRGPCPRCGCPRQHRCGSANGLQRYRCLQCGRSYNALTGTPLARLRQREKWLP